MDDRGVEQQPGLCLQQEGRNLEAGTKWDFLDGRLGITGAVYRAENRNELISDGLTPATYSQLGKRRVQGVELSIVGQVTADLNISAGFSTQNSKMLFSSFHSGLHSSLSKWKG